MQPLAHTRAKEKATTEPARSAPIGESDSDVARDLGEGMGAPYVPRGDAAGDVNDDVIGDVNDDVIGDTGGACE